MGEAFFFAAVSQLRASGEALADAPIIIVSEAFDNGLSHRLRELDVVHVGKSVMEAQTLADASVKTADTVVILSRNAVDPYADSVNFELTYRLRDMGFEGRIITEVVSDEKRERMRRAGASSVLRPIRAYPEMLTRAILAPGSEQVIETLFDSHGEECIRYDVHHQCTWLELINRLVQADIGLPIAYEDMHGMIHKNPRGSQQIECKALFVIVHEGKVLPDAELQAVLA
jgi:voltage-gated potassium channel